MLSNIPVVHIPYRITNDKNVTVTAGIPEGAFDVPVEMPVEVFTVYSDERELDRW